MRVAAHQRLRACQPHFRQELNRLTPGRFRRQGQVANQRLHQLFAEGQHRIERAHRLLKDHRQPVAAQIGHL